MTELLGLVREMAAEFEHANGLDDQTLDDIEHRARKLEGQAFDGDARAEESEQV
ncbi:hypothetical protein QA640_09380 [Bradyrhizobium sp. CB82]|uniref:hypothetical protein n=1 Tax=Bradyrhizobium sp. CB82 TaxID=3039159 RepID=UPI0024B110FE|nr:hypothetical protein [Bradyrhizobium sp. CB82]WFU42645.1 hypothetical protein QA640_09380 [Bradyrhizobium sp. CB82]